MAKIKPKCTIPEMMKIIRRKVPVAREDLTSEHRLVLAIIEGGIVDLLKKKYREEAMFFFNGIMFSGYCRMIDLNPATTRELLVEGGYLLPKIKGRKK